MVSEKQSNWFYPFSERIPLFVRGAFALPLFKRVAFIEKPDVICASWIWGCPYLAYLARLKPLVTIVVGQEISLDHNWNSLIRSQIKRTLRYAHAIVVDALCVKKKVLSYVDDEEKIFCIPVGVDTSLFRRNTEHRHRLRKNLGVTDDETLMICNRSHIPIYAVGNLIHAVPQVISKFNNIKFLLIGAGPLTNYYKRLVKEFNLSSHVLFVPRIPNEEMPKYLSASDVYVSPSLSDGTSVSLLEAMSCELPVVVADLPATREWVSDKQNGLLVKRSDPSLIAEGLVNMVSLKPEWKKFGQQNRKLIKEKADMSMCIHRLLKVYRYAIEKSHARA